MFSNEKTKIRNRIRSAQLLRNWRNADLSRAAGIAPETLRRWLGPRHRWSARQIVLLAGALGLDIAEVVGAELAAEIERDPHARFNQRGERLDESGLPVCVAHRPAPGREPDGRCSSCGRAPCAHAPGTGADHEDGAS